MKQILFRRCRLDRTSHKGFKYPKKGWIEAEDYNTYTDHGGGMHALRVGDDLGLLDPPIEEGGLWQVFTDCEGLIELKNEVKIQRGYVKTSIDISEYRSEFLKSPEWACWYARYIGKNSSDDTRKAACGDPGWAYLYAIYIDKHPSDDTRKAACGDPRWAYLYALDVDKCARDDTREAACGDSGYACRYSSFVDKRPSDDTRKAAYKDPRWKKEYQEWERKSFKEARV